MAAALALLVVGTLVTVLVVPPLAGAGGSALRHDSGASYIAAESSTKDPVSPIMRAYFINLDSSADRRAHMERNLAGFPGRVERVPAVPGDRVGRIPFVGYMRRQGLDSGLQRVAKKVARKTVACWLSHVTLWERLQTELAPNEAALIMEDDVQFPANWTADLGPTLRGAPRGWHVLKVCGWGGERARDVVDENWVVPRWPLRDGGAWRYAGSCGYIVTGSSVRHLLARVLSQPIKDIDVAMMLPEESDGSLDYFIYEQRPGHRLLGVGGFASTIRSGADGAGYGGDSVSADDDAYGDNTSTPPLARLAPRISGPRSAYTNRLLSAAGRGR